MNQKTAYGTQTCLVPEINQHLCKWEPHPPVPRPFQQETAVVSGDDDETGGNSIAAFK